MTDALTKPQVVLTELERLTKERDEARARDEGSMRELQEIAANGWPELERLTKECAALKAQLAECERERMHLAACGVVALANTETSAANARQIHHDYESASCSDVARAVDREMAERARAEKTERQAAAMREALGVVSTVLLMSTPQGDQGARIEVKSLAALWNTIGRATSGEAGESLLTREQAIEVALRFRETTAPDNVTAERIIDEVTRG